MTDENCSAGVLAEASDEAHGPSLDDEERERSCGGLVSGAWRHCGALDAMPL
jgi:hypothetical protein